MNPINILKYGAEEEKSESARMVSEENSQHFYDITKQYS